MSMELRSAAADSIRKYLAGEESLDSLKHWENSHSYLLDRSTDAALVRVTGKMAAAPYLVADGIVSELELREEFEEDIRALRHSQAA